jgi:hypothetical protein
LITIEIAFSTISRYGIGELLVIALILTFCYFAIKLVLKKCNSETIVDLKIIGFHLHTKPKQ